MLVGVASLALAPVEILSLAMAGALGLRGCDCPRDYFEEISRGCHVTASATRVYLLGLKSLLLPYRMLYRRVLGISWGAN